MHQVPTGVPTNRQQQQVEKERRAVPKARKMMLTPYVEIPPYPAKATPRPLDFLLPSTDRPSKKARKE